MLNMLLGTQYTQMLAASVTLELIQVELLSVTHAVAWSPWLWHF